MGRFTLISKLAARDLRYRRAEAVLLLPVITAATTTLTLALALNRVTSHPYQQTRDVTKGPDVVASFARLGPGPSLAVGLAAMKGAAASARRHRPHRALPRNLADCLGQRPYRRRARRRTRRPSLAGAVWRASCLAGPGEACGTRRLMTALAFHSRPMTTGRRYPP